MFLCCSALHLGSFQTSTTLHPWREEENYLTEDEISAELLAETLSDVPEDADSDSENDSESYGTKVYNRDNRPLHIAQSQPTAEILRRDHITFHDQYREVSN